MKEWLVVGRKIVCVNADPDFCPVLTARNMHGLTVGNTYTIRSVGYHHRERHFLCVWLEEIVRPVDIWDGCEVGFMVERFRPLLDRKTSISCFTKLTKTKTRELEGI